MATLKFKDANGNWVIPEDPTAVKYTKSQSLSNEQKRIARENIGAAAVGQGIPSFSPQDSGKLVIINEAGQLQAVEIAVSGAF